MGFMDPEVSAMFKECFPRYSLACLQMLADGYTLEDAAAYVGCEVDLAEDHLVVVRRCLGTSSLPQSVAVAMALGLIV